ncbi:DMT family transporter [Gymnodinialimonas sp. 57CJ19]|uniref:DMT family transporter n=1 Tax=Gymnodinialimonas sp. 57CJ19 TaxID=3138498 RepID=UPI00313447B1
MMYDANPRSGAPFAGLQANAGMLFMIGAMLLLPVGDTFAKLLSETLSPVGVTMCRVLAQAAFLVPVAYLLRHRLKGAMFSPIIAVSGLLLIISLTSLISAFAAMPIATAIAIFFVEPLILTVLAGVLLGETAGPRRLIAVGVGLIGAMIVIRPGFSDYGWATALPLISAFAYALNMVVLKVATVTRSGLTVQCGSTVYASLGLVVLAVVWGKMGGMDLVPQWGDTTTMFYIIGAGGAAAISFVMIAEAYRSADATALAPFQYLEIIMATALGFLIFGDFPDMLTWVGIAIILGSGIYVFHREGRSDTAAPRRKRASR